MRNLSDFQRLSLVCGLRLTALARIVMLLEPALVMLLTALLALATLSGQAFAQTPGGNIFGSDQQVGNAIREAIKWGRNLLFLMGVVFVGWGVVNYGTEKPAGKPAAPEGTPPARFPMPGARVTPTAGTVAIKLVNTTNAIINYQVVGVTQPRTLGEQSEILLNNLKAPLTLTYQRPDGGLLLVRPQATAMQGMLQVSFGATTDLGVDTKSMEVQEDGKVILN